MRISVSASASSRERRSVGVLLVLGDCSLMFAHSRRRVGELGDGFCGERRFVAGVLFSVGGLRLSLGVGVVSVGGVERSEFEVEEEEEREVGG